MYDYKVNLYGNMEVTVVAESKEEAERILKDTIESITVKDLRDKLSPNKDVEIKESHVNVLSEQKRDKNRDNER
ncbi:MAG: hypothetical protein IJ842_03440 [Bacilli bacterium]|nr:hypothetical protein [Bacilli bacterium]